MKDLDIKSLIIGTLLTATIFLGIAATGQTDKWDDTQQWQIKAVESSPILLSRGVPKGWEPFAPEPHADRQNEKYMWIRKRIK